MTMLEQLPMLNTMSPEYQADWHGLNRAALAQSPVAQGIFGPVLLGYREVQTVIRDRSFRNPPAAWIICTCISWIKIHAVRCGLRAPA